MILDWKAYQYLCERLSNMVSEETKQYINNGRTMNRKEAIKYMAEKPEENIVQEEIGNKYYYRYSDSGVLNVSSTIDGFCSQRLGDYLDDCNYVAYHISKSKPFPELKSGDVFHTEYEENFIYQANGCDVYYVSTFANFKQRYTTFKNVKESAIAVHRNGEKIWSKE